MDIRVAIFEDNKLVRDALEAILNGTSGYTCCGVFADGYWAVVPLSPWVHQLEVFGAAYYPRYKAEFSNHVIYTITVTP